jgi:hypothetical protein
LRLCYGYFLITFKAKKTSFQQQSIFATYATLFSGLKICVVREFYWHLSKGNRHLLSATNDEAFA